MASKNTERSQESRKGSKGRATEDEEESSGVSPIEVQKYLAGVDYPATKDDLIECAEENDADDDVLDFLESLPQKEFTSPKEVMKHFGSGAGEQEEEDTEGEETRAS